MDTSYVFLGTLLGLGVGLRHPDPNLPTPVALFKEFGLLVAFVLTFYCVLLVINRFFHPLPIHYYPALLLSFTGAIVVGRCLRIAYQMRRQRRR